MTKVILCAAAAVVAGASIVAQGRAAAFDHGYAEYAAVLHDSVRPPRVDYRALKGHPSTLDAAVTAAGRPTQTEEQTWTHDQRMAFWINAYNLFTLRAIVDHYPIRSRFLTLQPRNSIRQIDGVWTRLTWHAAGRTVTLDDIEHRILRPEFKDPRVHFAINCASIGCPPLHGEPYRAETLDAQLDQATRRYLSSSEGLQVDGVTLRVSSILKWYGEDFVPRFAGAGGGRQGPVERAILGLVAQFGPPAAASLARAPSVRTAFLDYDWSLNDVRPAS
jgi:hypothetical protein